ncbi:cell division protein FtsL [Fuchsiella alkaliacetigena]|uniref:cell division protein FtsL n=1 Tax=Fuchsiella alkaliacetigena TaxID=957042 RepID=UPI00200B240B|nr:cell division protein FtsL [Fuchsiella alkaliacetigena]MCK8823680.1 cell division protein FtsL [Fuchsiella alkaliacetigena]
MIVVDRENKIKDYKHVTSTAKDYQNSAQQVKKSTLLNRKKSVLYMFVYALLIGIIVVFGILYINKYVKINQTATEINKLQREVEVLEEKKRTMQLEISSSKSLKRIEKVAKEELGMVEPKQVNYLSLNDKKASTQKIAKEEKGASEGIIDFRYLGKRISTWFKGLTQLRAGTLEE